MGFAALALSVLRRPWLASAIGGLSLAQIESTAYLRNHLLRGSDWASMDHSVYLRTPLVDVQGANTAGDACLGLPRLPLPSSQQGRQVPHRHNIHAFGQRVASRHRGHHPGGV